MYLSLRKIVGWGLALNRAGRSPTRSRGEVTFH